MKCSNFVVLLCCVHLKRLNPAPCVPSRNSSIIVGEISGCCEATDAAVEAWRFSCFLEVWPELWLTAPVASAETAASRASLATICCVSEAPRNPRTMKVLLSKMMPPLPRIFLLRSSHTAATTAMAITAMAPTTPTTTPTCELSKSISNQLTLSYKFNTDGLVFNDH